MNKEQVKETSEQMLIQIIYYIKKRGLNEKDEKELLRELACSLVTSSLDINKSMNELSVDINNVCLKMRNLCLAEIFEYKFGD